MLSRLYQKPVEDSGRCSLKDVFYIFYTSSTSPRTLVTSEDAKCKRAKKEKKFNRILTFLHPVVFLAKTFYNGTIVLDQLIVQSRYQWGPPLIFGTKLSLIVLTSGRM